MPEHWPWRRADVALASLMGLALLAVFYTLALSERGLSAALVPLVTVCQRTLTEMLVHGTDLSRLSFLLPVGLGLVLATVEALRLTIATRRTITALVPAQLHIDSRLQQLARECQLDGATVLVHTSRPLVFTHGLIRPKVWLSTGLLDSLSDDELEAVLRHEEHHVQAHDPLKILVVRCLSRALFFIPVACDLAEAYGTAKELAADQSAVQAMGRALPLARALRKLIMVQPALTLDAALVSERHVTETRLLTLLDPARPLPFFPLRRLGLSLLWLMIFLAVAFTPAAEHVPSLTECAAAAPIRTLLFEAL